MARHKRSHPHGSPNRPRLWGKHAVAAALDNPARKVLRAWATRDAAGLMQFPKDVPVTFADVADLGRLVPHDAPHQGVVIEAEPLEDVWLGDMLADAPDRSVLLVLDQVTDPHNVGAILRSAAAFGAVGIVTQDRHSPPESGALAKAASGALERVPWARVVNLARALEEIGDGRLLARRARRRSGDGAQGRARPAAHCTGARRRRTRPATEHARTLRCAGTAADPRGGRKPECVQRRRRRPLRSKHRLMVRTAETICSSVEALAQREPAFAGALERYGPPEPRSSEPGAHTLLRTIVGQQVSVAAARSMWAKLEAAYGTPPRS